MAPVTRQQAKQNTPNQETTTSQMSKVTKDNAPTNFLSLPRKLRQQILLQSIPCEIGFKKKETKFPTIVGYRASIYQKCKVRCQYHTNKLCEADLSGCVKEDMKYVQKKWKQESNRVLKISMQEKSVAIW